MRSRGGVSCGRRDGAGGETHLEPPDGGIYVFARVALERTLSEIDTNNVPGEKYLTDAATRILTSGGVVDAIATDDTWLIAGVNDRS